MNYFIGLDNGGTFVKAALYDENGTELEVYTVPVQTLNLDGGMVERDMSELWNANLDCLSNLVKNVNVDPVNIKGIGLSGHGKGLYLLDKDKVELGNAILSSDSRAKNLINSLSEDEIDSIYELTGQEPISGQPSALLSWLKKYQHDIYSKIGYVLSVNDYIRFKLTNEVRSEETILSGSGLYNVGENKIDKEILKIYGIPEAVEMFPPIVHSNTNVSKVTHVISSLVGLSMDTIVSGGMFDVDACALTLGVTNLDQLFTVTGTWSINGYVSNKMIKGRKVGLNSKYVLKDTYLIEESSPTGAANMDSLVENFLSEIIDSKADIYRQTNNALMDDEIVKDLMVFPFLYGSHSKYNFKSNIVGFDNSNTRDQLIKAMCEGVCFNTKLHVDKLLATLTKKDNIRLGGGVAKSKLWTQLYADILGLNIVVVDEVEEMGCYGAALSVKSAFLGKEYSEIIPSSSKEVVFYPDKEKNNEYRKKYELYKKMYSVLEKLYI